MITEKDQKLVEHISDPKIQSVYLKFHRDDYAVLEEGAKLLNEIENKLDVLELMKESAEAVISDFGEHDDQNIELFGNHDQKYFEEMLKDIEGQITKEKAAGKTSDVFAIFLHKRKEQSAESDKSFNEAEKKFAQDAKNDIGEICSLLGLKPDSSPMVLMQELAKRGIPMTSDTKAILAKLKAGQ